MLSPHNVNFRRRIIFNSLNYCKLAQKELVKFFIIRTFINYRNDSGANSINLLIFLQIERPKRGNVSHGRI